MSDHSAVALAGADTLLILYGVIGILCYFWWSKYTPTVLFIPLAVLFAVAACAFVLEATSSIEQNVATIIAWCVVVVLLCVYFCFRLLFYTVCGVLLTLCLVPDTPQLSLLSFRYTSRVHGAGYILLSALIPTVLGAVAVALGHRFLRQTYVREFLVYAWSSQAVVLIGYIVYHGLATDRVPKIVTSPPEATQWAWILAIALCASARVLAVWWASRRQWCCNHAAQRLEIATDAVEDTWT